MMIYNFDKHRIRGALFDDFGFRFWVGRLDEAFITLFVRCKVSGNSRTDVGDFSFCLLEIGLFWGVSKTLVVLMESYPCGFGFQQLTVSLIEVVFSEWFVSFEDDVFVFWEGVTMLVLFVSEWEYLIEVTFEEVSFVDEEVRSVSSFRVSLDREIVSLTEDCLGDKDEAVWESEFEGERNFNVGIKDGYNICFEVENDKGDVRRLSGGTYRGASVGGRFLEAKLLKRRFDQELKPGFPVSDDLYSFAEGNCR